MHCPLGLCKVSAWRGLTGIPRLVHFKIEPTHSTDPSNLLHKGAGMPEGTLNLPTPVHSVRTRCKTLPAASSGTCASIPLLFAEAPAAADGCREACSCSRGQVYKCSSCSTMSFSRHAIVDSSQLGNHTHAMSAYRRQVRMRVSSAHSLNLNSLIAGNSSLECNVHKQQTYLGSRPHKFQRGRQAHGCSSRN